MQMNIKLCNHRMETSLSEETIYNLFYSHNAYDFDGQLSLIVASQHEDGLLLFLF